MNTNSRRTLMILTLIAVVAMLALAGCGLQSVRGSGTPVTREFDFSDFDQVSIEHAFRGTITRGDAYRVSVTVDDNLERYLQVEQNGGRVTIGFEDPVLVRDATLEYEITMPALTALNASGASNAILRDFTSSDAFAVEASGASRIEGTITTGDLTATASGASTISLAGQGAALRGNASGASTLDLEEFAADSANVDASGASTINVNTSGRLDASASGASNIHYIGNPQLGNISGSGGSEVGPR